MHYKRWDYFLSRSTDAATFAEKHIFAIPLREVCLNFGHVLSIARDCVRCILLKYVCPGKVTRRWWRVKLSEEILIHLLISDHVCPSCLNCGCRFSNWQIRPRRFLLSLIGFIDSQKRCVVVFFFGKSRGIHHLNFYFSHITYKLV